MAGSVSSETDRVKAMMLQDNLSLFRHDEERETGGQQMIRQNDQAIGRPDGQGRR
jgi:hypothetical protein